MAHAYGSGGERAPCVHFDETDDWTDETVLYNAALHELGHTLGLGHSDDPNAVMFSGLLEDEEYSISQDDINGIRALYGE